PASSPGASRPSRNRATVASDGQAGGSGIAAAPFEGHAQSLEGPVLNNVEVAERHTELMGNLLRWAILEVPHQDHEPFPLVRKALDRVEHLRAALAAEEGRLRAVLGARGHPLLDERRVGALTFLLVEKKPEGDRTDPRRDGAKPVPSAKPAPVILGEMDKDVV